MDEIKGCPFCGAEVQEVTARYNGKTGRAAVQLRCPDCCAEFKIKVTVDDGLGLWGSIYTAWNKRHKEPED